MNTHLSISIIMRLRDFGESDLLVDFFTAEEGRLRGVAKGARRSKRRFPNCLDLFCLARVEYTLKGKGDLCFLQSCKLLQAFPEIRSNFPALTLASRMVELTEILFPPGISDMKVFDLLKFGLARLNTGMNHQMLRAIFEARVMCLGGYGIDVQKCCQCGRDYKGEGRAVFERVKGGIACRRCARESELRPGLSPESVKHLSIIQSGGWREAEKLLLPPEVKEEIKAVLKRHIEYHLGERLKTSEYLE